MAVRTLSAYEQMIHEIQTNQKPSECSMNFMEIYIAELEMAVPDRSDWSGLELTMASYIDERG